MRLGGYEVVVDEGTIAWKIYGKSPVHERFRHRWEINPAYIEELERGGLRFSGWSEDRSVAHIAEIPDHVFFFGTQFHPEFTSSVEHPHPVFRAFVEAVVDRNSGSEAFEP